MKSAPQGTLILCYGNPLRQDDGVGFRAAELLAEKTWPADVAVAFCHQLTPEWAENLSRHERAIFVDASESGEPGAIRVSDVRPSPAPDASSHRCDPDALLGFAQRLFGAAPRARLVTITGFQFDYGAELSPHIRRRLPDLVNAVESEALRIPGEASHA